MTPRARRRRALLLAGLALAAGGLAASSVGRRIRDVEARVGADVPVLVARSDIPAGTTLDPDRAAGAFAVRRVPGAFVPPDALADPAQAIGLRLAAAVPRGGYVTAGALQPPRAAEPEPGPRLRRGERAAEVRVADAGDATALAPGARVDVLVTTEGRSGAPGRTYVALERVELLAVGPAEPGSAGDGGAGGDAGGGLSATLRVTARQAVFLTAAASFARELRLLARPPGDARRVGPIAVDAGGL